jgi:hypothetical protein
LNTFSNPLTEYSPQTEFESGPLAAVDGESEFGPFDELQELELAVGLLEVVNEEQLDRFLGDLIGEAEAAAGHVVKSSDARALNHVLKTAVSQMWQHASTGHGAATRGAIGAEFGRRLSSTAGEMLGLELEGLSPEDRDFEAARQFVRFAGEAVKNALGRVSDTDPHDGAHHAVTAAAHVYAPGLTAQWDRAPRQSGRWISCRGNIIVFGA